MLNRKALNCIEANAREEGISKWKAEKDSMVASFITIETIDILIPLPSSLAYTTAFFIFWSKCKTFWRSENTYWTNTDVTDRKGLYNSLFKMAAIDRCSAIVIGALLGWFCKINIFHEYCRTLKKYWILVSIFMGGDIMQVRYVI